MTFVLSLWSLVCLLHLRHLSVRTGCISRAHGHGHDHPSHGHVWLEAVVWDSAAPGSQGTENYKVTDVYCTVTLTNGLQSVGPKGIPRFMQYSLLCLTFAVILEVSNTYAANCSRILCDRQEHSGDAGPWNLLMCGLSEVPAGPGHSTVTAPVVVPGPGQFVCVFCGGMVSLEVRNTFEKLLEVMNTLPWKKHSTLRPQLQGVCGFLKPMCAARV